MRGMMLMRRITAFLCIALIWMLLFGACNSGSSGTSNEPGSLKREDATAARENSTSGLYRQHIKFTMNCIDADRAGKDESGKPDKVFEWLKNKFNFEFEWIPVTWEDYLVEKPSLWMASGDQPDLMMIDISPARYFMFCNWVDNGLLKPYPRFDEKYPNLRDKWEKATNGKKFEINGKVYAWPAFTDTDKYGYVGAKAWLYRIDWAEKVGLRNPNDEYTWDEWIHLIKTVIDKDPGGNGPGNTIGWIGEDWTFPRCLEGPRSLSPYLVNQQFVKKDGQWIWAPQLTESLEAIKLTRRLYDEKIIWSDQIIATSGDVANKMGAGLLFSTTSNNCSANVAQIAASLKKVNPDLKPEKALGWAVVKGLDGRIIVEQGSDHWTETALSPELTDEQLERWMDILDYLVSEEGYYVRNYGIPEEDWTIEDGKLMTLWPADENGVGQCPSGLYWGNSWQWAGRAGNSDLAQLENPLYPQWARERIKQIFERMQQEDVVVIPFNVELSYFNGPNYLKAGNMEREVYQEIARLMVSNNLEKDWNDWVAAQMPKIQPVLDELNASLE